MTISILDANVAAPSSSGGHAVYVTVLLEDQWFGLPIERVHDVFMPAKLTPVPLAPPEVVGLLNLRGRVVTAMCLRRRLGLAHAPHAQELAVSVEHGGGFYALFVDQVGEVLALPAAGRAPNPVHLDARWMQVSRGVHALSDRLLIVLDVDAVLALEAKACAA